MTTLGNNLEVDGTITARQATKAGECVTLGEGDVIPAALMGRMSDYSLSTSDMSKVREVLKSGEDIDFKIVISCVQSSKTFGAILYGNALAYNKFYTGTWDVPAFGPIAGPNYGGIAVGISGSDTDTSTLQVNFMPASGSEDSLEFTSCTMNYSREPSGGGGGA